MNAQSKKCPICNGPRSKEFSPFCSSRCRDRDLNKWFGDGYALPGRPASAEELASEIVREDRD